MTWHQVIYTVEHTALTATVAVTVAGLAALHPARRLFRLLRASERHEQRVADSLDSTVPGGVTEALDRLRK